MLTNFGCFMEKIVCMLNTWGDTAYDLKSDSKGRHEGGGGGGHVLRAPKSVFLGVQSTFLDEYLTFLVKNVIFLDSKTICLAFVAKKFIISGPGAKPKSCTTLGRIVDVASPNRYSSKITWARPGPS